MQLLELARIPPVVVATGQYLVAFGVVTIAGGAFGFAKAKSRASLIAGSIAGSALVVAGWLVGRESRPGIFLGLLVAVALAGRFGRAFAKTRSFMPAGAILLLSLIAIALLVAVLATFRG